MLFFVDQAYLTISKLPKIAFQYNIIMFDGSDFPKALDEALFEGWLETGRQSKIGYIFLLIIWNEFEGDYVPVYVENRDAFRDYQPYSQSTGNESLVAIYDLYSESRVALGN